MRLGFTMIEMLIVLGIMAILAIVVAPFVGTSVGRSQLKDVTRDIADTMRRAQTQAMTGNGNSSWGVHFQSGQYVLFKGNVYNAGDPENITTVLSSYLTISSIALNGGGSDVIFTTKKGDTTQYGSIQLKEVASTKTTTITISAAGLITYSL